VTTSTMEMKTEAPSLKQQNEAIQQLMEMSMGFMVASALHVAAKLNIADLLWDGPRPVSELAKETGMTESALYRVLRALASTGVFAELEGGCFTLTPAAYPLGRRAERPIRDITHWISDPFHLPIWAEALYSVQTGQPALELVHKKSTFEALFADEKVGQSFHNGMTNFSQLAAPAVLEAYDFSGIRKLVDVGGGHGALLRAILERHPGLHGMVYDLESVVAGAREAGSETSVSDRLEFAAGDMFESVPAGADAYLMKHIVHDWDDARSQKLLANCRRALGNTKNGRVLLVEGVIRPGNDPDPFKFIDLEMLMMCGGGKERTEAEYSTLLESAGLRLNRIARTEQFVDVIEALPV
jgi:hypothetical protein